MKPPRFKYVCPTELAEVLSVLDEYGENARVLAGGQSLVPLMNFRLARPDVLVDITRVPGLTGIRPNGGLAIGAATSQAAVERSSEIASVAPIINQALRHVGHPGIRSRGTFGGSIAHADPAGELPAVLLALQGQVVARSSSGDRVVDADDLFVTNFTTTLEENEVLTEVRLPKRPAGVRSAFLEVARRHGDFALVGVAAVIEAGDGDVKGARIVLTGVADTPLRAREAEDFLVGTRASDASAAEEAGRLAARSLEPPADFHASSEYRRDVAGALVTRALTRLQTQEETR